MTKSAAHFVDAGIDDATTAATWTSGTQTRNLWFPTGLSHLEAETVQVLGDGAYLGTETVTNGVIALDDNTTTNHVGLQYDSTLKPTKLDIEGMGLAIKKRVIKAIISFYNTLGGLFGANLTQLDTITFRKTSDELNDSADLFSGIKELSFSGDYEREGDVIVQQTQPLPMTCRGLILKLDANDD